MTSAPSKPATAAPAERKRVAKAHAASQEKTYRKKSSLKPLLTLKDPEARIYIGDCREIIPTIPECAAQKVDLVFADPPFNWSVPYDHWHDGMLRNDYLDFTYAWLKACADSLAPHGAMWVNIPDDTAMTPGQEFVKTWKVKNIGSCVWGAGYGLMYAKYTYQMSGVPQPLAGVVEIGQEVEDSVSFKAPDKAGEYLSAWQMANAQGIPFGKVVYVKILVK